MDKEKNTQKNKAARWTLGLLRGLLLLLIAGVIYVGVVLLESPEAKQLDNWTVIDDEPVSPLTAGTSGDAAALARMLGAPLPALRNASLQGEARNITHDGQNVRQVTLDYGHLRITALRPASAAPLLMQQDLSVSLRQDITVMDLPAMLSQGQGRYCLYFSSSQAAYAVEGTAESADAFLALTKKLIPVQ